MQSEFSLFRSTDMDIRSDKSPPSPSLYAHKERHYFQFELFDTTYCDLEIKSKLEKTMY